MNNIKKVKMALISKEERVDYDSKVNKSAILVR